MAKVHPLERFRKLQNPPMSRAELAAFLSVKRATVYRWLNGERDIDERLVPSIAEKTGIAPRELRPDLAQLIEGAQ